MSTESASVVIFNEQGEVLLQLRSDFRIWGLPAGRKEQGESGEECACEHIADALLLRATPDTPPFQKSQRLPRKTVVKWRIRIWWRDLRNRLRT